MVTHRNHNSVVRLYTNWAPLAVFYQVMTYYFCCFSDTKLLKYRYQLREGVPNLCVDGARLNSIWFRQSYFILLLWKQISYRVTYTSTSDSNRNKVRHRWGLLTSWKKRGERERRCELWFAGHSTNSFFTYIKSHNDNESSHQRVTHFSSHRCLFAARSCSNFFWLSALRCWQLFFTIDWRSAMHIWRLVCEWHGW